MFSDIYRTFKVQNKSHKLLSILEKIGSPARISELREAFPVHERTLRRWLLALCDEGKVEAIGVNKGRRYRLAAAEEADPRIEDGTLDALQQDLVCEALRDAVCGHTLTTLLTERIRTLLPAPVRPGFIHNTLQRLQSMTAREAESLGISREAFDRWRHLQCSTESRQTAAD